LSNGQSLSQIVTGSSPGKNVRVKFIHDSTQIQPETIEALFFGLYFDMGDRGVLYWPNSFAEGKSVDFKTKMKAHRACLSRTTGGWPTERCGMPAYGYAWHSLIAELSGSICSSYLHLWDLWRTVRPTTHQPCPPSAFLPALFKLTRLPPYLSTRK